MSEWIEGIDGAPYASTVLATYFDEEVGEWCCKLFVAERPEKPYTHWAHVMRPGEEIMPLKS